MPTPKHSSTLCSLSESLWPTIIVHATVVTPDAVLPDHAVLIDGPRIASVLPMNELDEICPTWRQARPEQLHDAAGDLVVPGFIDLHSDNIETVVQPRPTSIIDFSIALLEQEKQLVNEGITMMFHSLSFLRRDGNDNIRDKEVRKPERMKELARLIQNLHQSRHLIRHRFHCRFDLRNIEGYATLLEYLDHDYIHLLSFIDHTPGQGQYRDLVHYRQNIRNYRPTYTDELIDQLIDGRRSAPALDPAQIIESAAIARSRGVPIASHDDDSAAKVDFVRGQLHAAISEFPVELDVAREARRRGMLTVAGAPNVLMGRSHSGNLSAVEAILAGQIDILCSDYYPPAILHALFKLHFTHGLDLPQAVRLATWNPARALGQEQDFGSVTAGHLADLLIIHIDDQRPYVRKVFIDGDLVSELRYRRKQHA